MFTASLIGAARSPSSTIASSQSSRLWSQGGSDASTTQITRRSMISSEVSVSDSVSASDNGLWDDDHSKTVDVDEVENEVDNAADVDVVIEWSENIDHEAILRAFPTPPSRPVPPVPCELDSSSPRSSTDTEQEGYLEKAMSQSTPAHERSESSSSEESSSVISRRRTTSDVGKRHKPASNHPLLSLRHATSSLV